MEIFIAVLIPAKYIIKGDAVYIVALNENG